MSKEKRRKLPAFAGGLIELAFSKKAEKPSKKMGECFQLGAIVNDLLLQVAEAREKIAAGHSAAAKKNLVAAQARLSDLQARMPSITQQTKVALAGIVRATARTSSPSLGDAGKMELRSVLADVEKKTNEILHKAKCHCGG